MAEKYTKYWELYIKQKGGKISAEEQIELSEWKEKNLNEYHEFEKIFQASDTGDIDPKFRPQESWQEFHSLIKIEKESQTHKTIQFFPWIARVASAIILVLGFAFIFYQYQQTPSNNLNLQAIVQTDETSQKIVELPDGSTVWLNRKSELLYPQNFDGETRTIYLKGEAFFDVTPNKDKPFIVHSGISKTTVLGASFNLRVYSKEDEVRLTVVTGKVSFAMADEKEGVIVSPGNMARLSNNVKSIAHSENSDLNFLSWKTRHLTFDDTPMDELIKSLERHYGIVIKVQNPATLSCRFTGDFQETGMENTIKIITRTTGTSYELIKGEYKILGTGCN